MRYGTISGSEKRVSRIVYGTANARMRKGEEVFALLDEVWAQGINAFDTARVYGKAEEVLGRWMEARGCRSEVFLITKGGHPALFSRLGERAIRRDLKRSLEALRTDSIDLYLLHRDDPRRPVGEIVELLNALHAEGKVGAFGGSNWTAERIESANEYAYRRGLFPFSASGPAYGLAVMQRDPWGNGAVSISGKKNAPSRTWYAQSGCAVFAYSALGHGLFSDGVKSERDLSDWGRRAFGGEENFSRLARCRELAKEKGASAAQIALAYLLSGPMNAFAVATSLSHIADLAAASELTLTKEERDFLSDHEDD